MPVDRPKPYIEFNWSYPDKDPHIEFRLYEDNALVVPNIGELFFSLSVVDNEPRPYAYAVTAYNMTTKLESDKSAAVTINFQPPAIPADFTASLVV